MGLGEASGPLVLLGRKLRRPPPSLSRISAWLQEAEFYPTFKGLVEEYLDAREDVLGRDIDGMVTCFIEKFTERYFPLEPVSSLGELVRFIPVEVYGWDEEDYHNLPQADPGVLLPSLFVDELENLRIPALEAATAFIPQKTLKGLARSGYPLQFLEQVLPGTPYEDLLSFAQVLCRATGCVFWDLTSVNIRPPSSGWMGAVCDWSYPEWSRENVDTLTEEWARGQEIHQALVRLSGWIEADPPGRFAEIVQFLKGEER